MTWLIAVLLAWTAPTERENGDYLPPEEISHYVVLLNGQFYDNTEATEYEALAKGDWSVQCVDVYGFVSETSNVISTRYNPKAPGHLRTIR